ncbi:putative ribonuclease H-like domain-containing protein [Tanacetum coccineum]
MKINDGGGNLFLLEMVRSVSQICDKKNNVLFTNTECLVLSFDFKLLDESQVLLRFPRKDNIYSVDLKSVVPAKGLTCLFAKATIDESNLWHMRLGHINFKNINKLVKGNLVRGLPSKIFENNHSCVGCQNGKQHKASSRVLVIKPHNKTPYELIRGRTPLIDFMKPFGCPITILNTKDHLGKFDGKADEGFFVGYSVASKAMRVFNKRTRIVEKDSGLKPTDEDVSRALDKDGKDNQATRSEFERLLQQEKQNVHPNNTNSINTVSTPISAAGPYFTNDDPSSPVNAAETSNAFEEHLFERFSPFKNAFTLPFVSNVTPMDDTRIFNNAYDDEDVGADADLNNLETTMNVSPIPTTRINKDHPKDQIIRYFNSVIQTRRMTNISDEHAIVCYINKQRRTNHKDYQNYLFARFLSQMEPKKVIQALEDPSWIETMKEELLQFQLQKVWTLVNLPNGKRAIRTKWAFRNKKDKRGIVIRNKARLVAQGCTQEEGIYYDEVFAPIARIEAIRKDKGDILLVQVYVDDIIFGSTKKSLCDEFEDHDWIIDVLIQLLGPDIHVLLFVLVQDSLFDLEAFSDSNYARASLDRKSTTGGCQFLVKRLISWQFKKQTIVSNSTTEAEYVDAANCCGQVLWIP